MSKNSPKTPNRPGRGETLPVNLEAEEALLGSLLIDPARIPIIRALLEPMDFAFARHQAIYQAMLYLVDEAMPVDMVTLGRVLNGKVKDAELTALLTATPTSIHAEHYAAEVRRVRVQRELIDLAAKLTKDAFEANGNLPELTAGMRVGLARVERLLLNASDGISLRQSLDAYMDLLEALDRDKEQAKLEFPWRDFRHMEMPFLDAGTLVGVLAEPGVGKTAFMENCAEHWAGHGWRIAFFHLELSTAMMLHRRMQRHSGIPIRRLQLGGQLDSAEYGKILDALARIERWPGNIQYVHCPGWSISQVMAAAQKLHDAGGLDVVILDYLNKVKLVERVGLNAAQLRGQDIEDFKTALEVNGWVGLMAAQFDKASKGARRKTLADARDTGELEDKANLGIVLDRPYVDVDRTPYAKLSVVKNNAGPTGGIDMYYKGDRLAFYDVDRHQQSPA